MKLCLDLVSCLKNVVLSIIVIFMAILLVSFI